MRWWPEPDRDRYRYRRRRHWVVLGLGWIFVLLGIAGLFLPFLQGILFLLVGLFLLSQELVWARWLRKRLMARAPPGLARRWRAAEATARRWLTRVSHR